MTTVEQLINQVVEGGQKRTSQLDSVLKLKAKQILTQRGKWGLQYKGKHYLFQYTDEGDVIDTASGVYVYEKSKDNWLIPELMDAYRK